MSKNKRVKLIINNNEKSLRIAEKVKSALLAKNFEIVEEDYSVAISIGGDGAFLRMVKETNFNSDVLYVGVNAGTLGFAHEHMENTDPDDLPGIGTMDQYYIDYWVNNKGTINYQTYGNMRLLPVVELDEDVLLASDNEGDGSSYENAWRIDDEIEDVKVDDEEDAYENFLNHRYYYYDEMDDWETSIDREYALCDLNGDGIKELVIIGYYGNTIKDFYFTLIYTYDDKNNEVVFVDEFYSYAGLRFNEETKEIAYAELRPYRDAGGYTFYKFDGKELVEEKAAWYSYNDYHITEKDGTEKSVTAEEYTANFDGFNYLDYSEIKRK